MLFCFRKILELGFDESFIRTWEYYFDYCAAGFKSRIIGDYQVLYTLYRMYFVLFIFFFFDNYFILVIHVKLINFIGLYIKVVKRCDVCLWQIVFSRAGNVTTFNNPYKGIPSANSLS